MAIILLVIKPAIFLVTLRNARSIDMRNGQPPSHFGAWGVLARDYQQIPGDVRATQIPVQTQVNVTSPPPMPKSQYANSGIYPPVGSQSSYQHELNDQRQQLGIDPIAAQQPPPLYQPRSAPTPPTIPVNEPSSFQKVDLLN